MERGNDEELYADLLAPAGIRIDGDRSWDIQVRNEGFYRRVLAGGSLALGESYMDGWWTCAALDQFFDRLLRARLGQKLVPLSARLAILRSRLFNLQSKMGARAVVEGHYQRSPRLFMSFLDPFWE